MTILKQRITLFFIPVILLQHINCFAKPPSQLSFQNNISPTATVTQWSPFLEWTIKNPSYQGNPFDLSAKVTFIHEGTGKQITTEMFYDDNSLWKFRFTGTKTGKWKFATKSDDPDLDEKKGFITVIPNHSKNTHGFVTNLGNKWAWQGTGRAFVPQLIMYTGIPRLWNKGNNIDKDIKTFFIDHGFNGIHIPTVGGNWFDFNTKNKSTNKKLGNPDPRTFRGLESLICKIHRAGGFVHIWAWGDHQRKQTPLTLKGGPQGEVDKRLQRYIAARLGPVPGWTIGYGFDLQEWAAQAGRFNYVVPWCHYLHAHMGWRHMIGGRMGPTIKNGSTNHFPQAPLNEGLDYYGYEHHRPTYEMYRAALKFSRGKPVFSEDRFRVRVPPLYPDKDYNEDLTRRGLYHSAMAGGVANIWGTNVPGGWGPGGISRPYTKKEWIKTYSLFMNNRFLNDMIPYNIITDGVCLKSPSEKSYIFYKENTVSVQMDLSELDTALTAVAVDTKKQYSEISMGKLKPGKQAWKAPYRSDWAIAAGKFHN